MELRLAKGATAKSQRLTTGFLETNSSLRSTQIHNKFPIENTFSPHEIEDSSDAS